jgi:hypothetical protein
MKLFAYISAVLGAIAFAGGALGHGTQIIVDVVAGGLKTSNGMSDPDGYASMIWVESDDAGDPFGDFTIAPFGPITFWEIPGFELHGLEGNSGLYLELVPRPMQGLEPVEQRLLWYWDPATEMVDQAPPSTEFHFLSQYGESRTILPGDTAAPAPLLIANPTNDEQGFHNHLLGYALDNDPAAAAGAYGFFARLTSDLYEPSDPFLVVLNNSVDYSDMIAAALAINAAAVDADPLLGDYNDNGFVDAADYTVWRDAVATSTELINDPTPGTVDESDFEYWRAHFGEAGGVGSGSARHGGSASGASPSQNTVPEPNAALLAAFAALMLISRRRCRGSLGKAFRA